MRSLHKQACPFVGSNLVAGDGYLSDPPEKENPSGVNAVRQCGCNCLLDAA